ncbi:nucleotidyl transferase AbiEii/AbiGii toxin family protein [Fibrobacter sp.]|uniref:nucleotidyl transferase AbiEii/AbiGii toxin family protein n=1 Tax=Fibrobacter sp. TaxID=35828 RepID=UPI00388D8A79
MKTRNAMQLKALIKSRSIEIGLTPQQALHAYYMECFVNRLAHSDYLDNFVLKGGYLISNLIGFESRTTMDVDSTIKNLPIEETVMTKAFTHICGVQVEDDFTFTLDHLEFIREDDEYHGIRAFLNVDYEEMHGILTVDVTAGDSIYPGVQQMFFKRNFDKSLIRAWSYPVETVLAEKLETIITRSILNKRPRDYYDIHMLTKSVQFDIPTLNHALLATAAHRKTKAKVLKYAYRIEEIEHSDDIRRQWEKYSKTFSYAKGIPFETVVGSVRNLLEKVLA